MSGQQFNLQPCDELEIRRLLWSDRVRPQMVVRVTSSPTTNTTTAHSHSSQEQPLPPTTQQPKKTPIPTTSRNDHHQKRELSPSDHVGPQYTVPIPPYNLRNKVKASSSQEQPLSTTSPTTSVLLLPPTPSMPNRFTPIQTRSRKSFTNFIGPVVFQQQQERENTPEPEREMSEEDQPANSEDSGDDDYECEEEEDDEEIVAQIAGPFQCGLCQKIYKKKAYYLAHLNKAHNPSSTPPNPKPRKNRKPRQPRNENSPQSSSSTMVVDRREEHNDQDLPDDTPESINAAKIGDSYQCSKCSKKYRHEKNFRKHLQLHRQKESERSNGENKMERDISGITEVPSHPHHHPHPAYHHVIIPSAKELCPYCDEFLADQDKLKNHVMRVHKPTLCIDCRRQIPETEFPEHKKKHLIEPPKWKCHVCKSSFDIYKSFKEHLQTHLAEPYREPSQDFLTRKVPTLTVPVPTPGREDQDDSKPMMNDEPMDQTSTDNVELIDIDGEENDGEIGQTIRVALDPIPSKWPCLVCGTIFQTNTQAKTHILNEHCKEVQVSLVAIENDLELLGNFEIMEVGQ